MPVHDEPPAAGAVEVVIERPPPTFMHGACAGLALAAIAAQVWLAVTLAPLRDAYLDMTGAAPFVLASWWRWGVPAAGFVVLVPLVAQRPRMLVPYVVLAVVLVAATIATWRIAYAPLYSLSTSM